MRLTTSFLAAGVALATCASTASAQYVDTHAIRETVRSVVRSAYQGRDRGPEQTEHVSNKYKVARDGRVSLQNISGDIVVTGGSGDEVTVEATKRTRGDRGRLGEVRIDVSATPARVDIRTEYPRMTNMNVSVDYTVTVPNGASVDIHSVSGTVKVTAVRGSVRMETISGGVTASDTPNVELAKTVSGDVSLSGISTDGTLTAGTISGTITAKGLKARRLELSSVSGDVNLVDVTTSSVHAKSISGGFEYAGAIAKSGDYDVNTHSGSIRFSLSNPSGFYLNADSFSGSIRTDYPVTIGGNTPTPPTPPTPPGRMRGPRGVGQGVHGVNGDGSATLTLRTFSGDIVIAKR
ncbi:MAG TPA: DUF4097 family beta strand repeat-containing protein [Vicinamibacterales bacterium]|nr:DUF4097 family beta strand repeat-containing protein [Vicinamibacterales bacterium]